MASRLRSKPRPLQQPPLLFTSGNRIQAPQLGAADPGGGVAVPRLPQVQLVGGPPEVSGSYVRKISSDLAFAEEVVLDRCAHALGFSDRYLDGVFDPHSAVPGLPRERRLRLPAGRHNHRGPSVHASCLVRRPSPPQMPLPPRIEEPSAPAREEPVVAPTPAPATAPVFLTEGTETSEAPKTRAAESAKTEEQKEEKQQQQQDEEKGKEEASPKKENGWDEYVMSLLSVNTARWLALELTEEDDRKANLGALLERWYGPPPEMMDLVPDDPRLFGEPPPLPPIDHYLPRREEAAGAERRKWRKKTPVLRSSVEPGEQTDPYGDSTSAPYYRLPAGIRRRRRAAEEELAGAINATAAGIRVQRRSPTPPPTLRDFLRPGVGDKFFDTANAFQREWLTGGAQVHLPGEDARILMGRSHNAYRKRLRQAVPSRDLSDKRDGGEAAVHRQRRGPRRWEGLPEPLDDRAMGAQPEKKFNFEEAERQKKQEMESRRKIRNNNSLVKIVDEWRTKWHMNQRFADCSVEALLRDMADMHATIRLQAVLTTAKAASFVPPPTEGIQLNSRRQDFVASLPEPLFDALEFMLDDSSEHVRKAAAIALYTLQRPCAKAEALLRRLLVEGSAVDRWASAQCLAHFGVSDGAVVGELVNQLMTSEDSVIHEQATHLLSALSRDTRLVHGMLAEQLNSSSWRHKIIVCKALPVLHGKINKDLSRKLGALMWSDWHSEVRVAAAQALGKTGHGKAVHDDLRERLATGSERVRADAVQKMGFLGIMTTRLMPVFITCFDDSYVSVRQEACVACGRLRVDDKRVLDKLVHLATFDPIWRVKAHAIRALGLIGEDSPPVRHCLLWAVRYETEAAVRAEAVRAVLEMGALDAEVAEILRDRHLVEASPLVAREIERGLALLGISPSEDIDMVAQIKREVRRLNRKQRICDHIGRLERAAERQELRRKMIAEKPKTPAPATAPPTEEQDEVSAHPEARPELADLVEEDEEAEEEEEEEEEPRSISRSTRVTSAVTGLSSPTRTERSGSPSSRHSPDRASPWRPPSSPSLAAAPTPVAVEEKAPEEEEENEEDEDEEAERWEGPPSVRKLYRMTTSIRPMPVERGATWMSLPSEGVILEPPGMPLRDSTVREMERLSHVEGLDLGPRLEDPPEAKKTAARKKQSVGKMGERKKAREAPLEEGEGGGDEEKAEDEEGKEGKETEAKGEKEKAEEEAEGRGEDEGREEEGTGDEGKDEAAEEEEGEEEEALYDEEEGEEVLGREETEEDVLDTGESEEEEQETEDAGDLPAEDAGDAGGSDGVGGTGEGAGDDQ